ncbi:DEAD/DEAH box helicase [Sandaracinus amylolyticus]|uniref:DEAD/DEAH box helicase n=1 Tax=Sandaracinus amylolyticus TaxID=927083 RepID=UPI001F2BFF6F|nr:DEAD/DEAH box helicase [Sandaracinus amylolyticus]
MTEASSQPTPPTFDALDLTPEVRKAVDEMGFTSPTPVQHAVFEPAIAGSDLIVQARTGTGKTAAFGLPMVDRRVRPDGGQQALILAPTRELALQSAREIEKLGKHKGIRVVAVYGGAPMERQVREIEEGAQIVSGTPGRVLDHLRRGTLRGEDLRILVLDEADEMLSMGFAKELNAIVDLLPKSRQTMLFSATLDEAVQRLAQRFLKDPVPITLSSDAVGALTISHYVYLLSGLGKSRDLMRILEVEDPESAIIFCNTKATTEQVAAELQQAGFQADWLNGDLPQSEREKVLERTRRGELRYLVATDVAARGIDISHLTHVINYDFPEQIESYVHRTGRTGRAGRTGTAIALVTPQDLGALYYVRLAYKIFPIERTLPSAGELKARAELDRIEMLSEAFPDSASEADRAIARRLLVHDDAERIVGGLLRAFFGSKATAPGEVDEQAAAARRARTPRGAVSAPVVEASDATTPGVEIAVTSEGEADEGRRRRRRRERTGEVERVPPAAAQEVSVAQLVAAPAPAEGPPDRIEEPLSQPDASGEDPSMSTLFINLGRRDGVRVGDIIRLFETHASLGKDDLGRIRIRDRHTFVGVPRERVDAVVSALNGQSSHEKELVVEVSRAETQARSAPDAAQS